jgi:hypothetical protein
VTFTLVLCFVLSLCFSAAGQQSQTFTWSSKDCSTCESSILNPGWYSDGSGIFIEAIPKENAFVTAGVSGGTDYFFVAVAVGIEGTGTITVDPMRAVMLESDSSPHMVLFPIRHPDLRSYKGTVVDKKQLKDKPVNVTADKPAAGYLVFAADNNASHVIVVVEIGNETFRFPFVRNPSARGKFVDPDTSSGSTVAQGMQAATAEDGKPQSPQLSALPAAEMAASSNQQASTTAANGKPSQVAVGAPRACDKNVSFAVAEGGQIVSRVPAFADKWISKNQKKYAGLCFSQAPDSRAANYLLVFSTSRSAFNGIYPTVRTDTSTNTSTTPVSGSGTVTDNYGGMWNYTYDGTATTTTTTTTTTHENLPYTDTSNTLYLNSYDQQGRMISQRWRTITTRQGGDGANTLGYNLGAALGAIHMKEHLLKSVVEDVAKGSR